ncbi:MAG: hypothetical protein GY936_20805 [Ignavibacteriae bacterium]|nr:hypothetical protein [Ignavibacteriota bacterium]
MKNILIIISFCFLSTSFAQVTPSISNLMRYGNGNQSIGNSENKFQYFENLTDVRVSFPKKISIGFRFLYDDPPEVGAPFRGLSKRFIEYRDEGFSVRVGNSSELYSHGLVLNLFENRGLAYDTWLDGVKTNYKYSNFNASLIAGTIDFRDSINIARHEKYKLHGGNVEYKIKKIGKVGASFISAEATIPQSVNNKIANVELPEIYFDINYNELDFHFGWAQKWVNVPIDRNTSRGTGIYSSLSFAGENLGITIDYKNYKFDLQDPFLKNDETRTTKLLPFQNPPIGMKEHSYTLLTRALHQVDFNNEVGIQLDAIYTVNEDLNFSLNMSLSSTHNSYLYNNSTFSFTVDETNNLLPSTKINYSPYSEIFIEGEYYFDYETALRFGFAKREKTLYNDFTGAKGSHTIKSFVIPIQFQTPLSKSLSTTLQYEFETVNDNFNVGQETINNHFLTVFASLVNKITFALRYELTSNDFDPSNRKDWLVGELGYRISGSNLVSLSYGRERGGQICSNGICRYILPFKGLRFSLQTNI